MHRRSEHLHAIVLQSNSPTHELRVRLLGQLRDSRLTSPSRRLCIACLPARSTSHIAAGRARFDPTEVHRHKAIEDQRRLRARRTRRAHSRTPSKSAACAPTSLRRALGFGAQRREREPLIGPSASPSFVASCSRILVAPPLPPHQCPPRCGPPGQRLTASQGAPTQVDESGLLGFVLRHARRRRLAA